MNDVVKEQIRSLLLQGNKIEAIKIYREATGLGLAESKSAVEMVEAELKSQGQLPVESKKSGCFALISLLLILLYGVLSQF